MEHAHETQHHHITTPKTYAMVLGALLMLTVITVLASYIHFGSGAANVVIAMGIASLKASLVALFFMHLRHDNPLNAVLFVASLVFFGILLTFTFIDVSTRPVPVVTPSPAELAAPAAANVTATPPPAAAK